MLFGNLAWPDDFCRKALKRSAHVLRRDLGTDTENALPEAGSFAGQVAEQRWFLNSQLDELEKTFTPQFTRNLLRDDPDVRAAEPRIYRGVARTLGCLLSSNLGSHLFGRFLGTAALTELFSVQEFGDAFTLRELRAVPAIAKLIVMERIAEIVDAGLSNRDAALRETHSREFEGVTRCLQTLGRVRWPAVIEAISPVHRLLQKDPSGAYPAMDPESREAYLETVARIAEETDEREDRIAYFAQQLAWEAAQGSGEVRHAGFRTRHVGYYLLTAPGVAALRRRGRLTRTVAASVRDGLLGRSAAVYLLSTAVFAAIFAIALSQWMEPASSWWNALLAFCAMSPAVALTNLLVSQIVPRRPMPRLDFSKRIPDEHRTMVVVPTLLLSRAGVDRLIEQLEIHSLSNRDANLSFALLTDFRDAASPEPPDASLLQACIRGIRRLNRRYEEESGARFYLFHRNSEWNESQRCWMGRERKRGKLEDFNRLVLGKEDRFAVKIGDLSRLSSIRHVITLDSDTQLSPDAAWKLIGTLAHPLNQPVTCPHKKELLAGYTILQPNVNTSVESAARSYFAKLYGDTAGLDPYTNSRVEVYYDLHGRSSYFGKGIYDVAAFDHVLGERFPDNALLSHDLIEGEFAGVGYVSGADVVEDFPRAYEAFSKRKHRWMRGDWQILPWLGTRVRSAGGARERNTLTLVSRWKILDNLRRSLFEPALFVLVAAAWWWGPEAFLRAMLAVGAIVLLPAYSSFAASLLRLPSPLPPFRAYLKKRLLALGRSHVQALADLCFLPHQAYLAADAILRTLLRQWVTRRNLLEWETMAQTDMQRGSRFLFTMLTVSVVLTLAVIFAASGHPLSTPAAILLCLWIAAPGFASLLSQRPWQVRPRASREARFLRDIALRTWRYFVDFGRPEENWLVPDNIQEDPYTETHKASPTNIGLQMACNVAALDFGYVTRIELAIRLGDLLGTVERLAKHNGHLLNWYDTETLQPLAPRYVSTVDSGNLAASLIAVRQACLRIGKHRMIAANTLEGVRDHCLQLRRMLPVSVRLPATYHAIQAILRRLEARPANLLEWEETLSGVRSMVLGITPRIETVSRHIESHDSSRSRELQYWFRALQVRLCAARENLLEFAPWLRPEHLAHVKAWAADSRFDDLIAEFGRNPEFSEWPELYERIDECIAILLDAHAAGGSGALDPSMWRALVELRYIVSLARGRHTALLERFSTLAACAERLARNMDFSFLLDGERELLRIGYNVDTETLDDSHYDLLASEARTALFLAVAKGDAPLRSWFQLGRKITSYRGHDTLMSWSGTMFEYLMPSLFMRSYETTLLDASLKGAVRAQQAYARDRDVPWGISESSCSWRNEDLQYFYHAFGLPGISLRGDESGRLVIAPYASMLALMTDHETAAKNLRDMAHRGWTGRYGFFEAAEFQSPAPGQAKSETLVRSFMAHHQGMGLLALCNSLLGNPMQERFHAEPMVAAAELLLQERLPAAF